MFALVRLAVQSCLDYVCNSENGNMEWDVFMSIGKSSLLAFDCSGISIIRCNKLVLQLVLLRVIIVVDRGHLSIKVVHIQCSGAYGERTNEIVPLRRSRIGTHDKIFDH